MADEKSRCCEGDVRLVLACSGGSNVGQITNEIAKKLDEAGEGKFFCLAGVGGHISGMVASVKGSDRVLVLDGCPVACAKKCVEAAGVEGYKYLIVTEFGVEKKHEFDLAPEKMDSILAAAQDRLRAREN